MFVKDFEAWTRPRETGTNYAEGKDYILLTHMLYRKLPVKSAEWFEKTERFAQLLAERKIRVVTLGRLIEERFGKDAEKGK